MRLGRTELRFTRTATGDSAPIVKATVLKLFLALAILVCTLGHRDAAFAHVSKAAVSAVHGSSDENAPAPADHVGHVAHHHCPAAMREAETSLVAAYRLAAGRRALPADTAKLLSRTVAPLPEPPTA